MSIYINDCNKVNDIFINVNGKKKLNSMWVNKNGNPTKVFSTGKKIYDFSTITWADGTDEEIAAMLDAHYAGLIDIHDYWHVGDERVVHLSAINSNNLENQTSQDINLAIIGFQHDLLQDKINGNTRAAISVSMTSPLNSYGKMSNNETSAMNGWRSCLRRTWCNNNFKNSLPPIISSLIKPVVKKSSKKLSNYSASNILETKNEYCWLFSISEITGSNIGTATENDNLIYLTELGMNTIK